MTNKIKMERYTIQDFNRDFPNDGACLEWLKNYLYPHGIHCHLCKKVTPHHKMVSRKSYSCNYCGNHVHPTAETIYHKSSTSLRLWFYAIYLMASTRCGISAKQLERELGVTYKTAWRMFKQIRSMLDGNNDPFSGKVEADETYIGGKMKGGKRGRGSENKAVVAGILEREGKVVAKVVQNVKASTLVPLIQEKVLPGSMVFTDELPSYNSLGSKGYEHQRVNHSAKVYVMGEAHTNSIEGFWSCVKNGIRGVYHSVSHKHLQSYVNEYAFRYNRRQDVPPMFVSFLSQVRKSCHLPS